MSIALELGYLAPTVRHICARIFQADWALFVERDDLRCRIVEIVTEEVAGLMRDRHA